MFYELTDHFLVDASAEAAWGFFSDAANLSRITPPRMRFRITSPMPLTMGQDTLIDYRITIGGLPIRWRTRLIDWSPPGQFIDLQLRGPYTLWHHQHTFTARAGPDGRQMTECRDRVIYKLPGGVLGPLVHAAFVRGELLDIFTFRREAIGRLLGALTSLQPEPAIKRVK